MDHIVIVRVIVEASRSGIDRMTTQLWIELNSDARLSNEDEDAESESLRVVRFVSVRRCVVLLEFHPVTKGTGLLAALLVVRLNS